MQKVRGFRAMSEEFNHVCHCDNYFTRMRAQQKRSMRRADIIRLAARIYAHREPETYDPVETCLAEAQFFYSWMDEHFPEEDEAADGKEA